MEFRSGDVVSVEGVVDFTTDTGFVYVKPSHGEAQRFKSEAVTLISRRFEVGETVRVKNFEARTPTGLRYSVLAVDDEQVWAKRLDVEGKRVTLNAKDLESAPAIAAGFETEAFPIGETFVDGRRVPPPKPQPQAKGKVPEPSMEVVQYTVVEGDTLTGIANTFETSVDTIAIANGIADPDLILAGQVLKIQDNRIPF